MRQAALERRLTKGGVVRGAAPGREAFLAAATAQGLRPVVVELGGVSTKAALLRRLAAALGFAADFGMNLDALRDSLADLVLDADPPGLAILLTGLPARPAAAAQTRPAAEAILEVMQDCAGALGGGRRLVVLAS